ncbi:MAG: RNA methyltransferase [Paraprevotella sp.]|nr:RNA methyltransferase [Paraprevotella sp.]
MISKNKIKLIRSLEQKKYRKESQLFVAEGHKLVEELLPAFECMYIAARREWLERRYQHVTGNLCENAEIQEVSAEELQKASLQRNPQDVLALFRQRTDRPVSGSILQNQLSLGLDGVQDPGNLGTIIRLADWFGIEHLFCSPDTADLYNPKTVQATMGAMARVKVHYLDLKAWLQTVDPQTPIYGTLLDGENIYDRPLTPHGLVLMGNEGNGIRPDTAAFINRRLLIPNYPSGRATSESLNVAIATAIVCAEFRRQASMF